MCQNGRKGGEKLCAGKIGENYRLSKRKHWMQFYGAPKMPQYYKYLKKNALQKI